MDSERPSADGQGSAQDNRSPVQRSLRVKRSAGRRTGPVDLGAVSIGLVPVVFVLLAAIAGPMPNWIRLSAFVIAIILGALAAGYATETTWRAASQNGVGVVVAAAIVMGATWITIGIGAGQVSRIPLFHLVHMETMWLSSFVAFIAMVAGASIGMVGHHLRFRETR